MLSHPNIVKVYDVSFGDMIQYIVMEYIDGITLKEYIDQQGIIEWKDAIHLTAQILKALQHAHECGIVHRDIKPQILCCCRTVQSKLPISVLQDFPINRHAQ